MKELTHGAGLMVFELESTGRVVHNLILCLLRNYGVCLGSQIIFQSAALMELGILKLLNPAILGTLELKV